MARIADELGKVAGPEKVKYERVTKAKVREVLGDLPPKNAKPLLKLRFFELNYDGMKSGSKVRTIRVSHAFDLIEDYHGWDTAGDTFFEWLCRTWPAPYVDGFAAGSLREAWRPWTERPGDFSADWIRGFNDGLGYRRLLLPGDLFYGG